MNKLSGHKDTDFIILNKLNDFELKKVCQVNKYVNSLCNEPQFWLNRIIANFPLTGEETRKIKDYLNFATIKELYVYLNSIPKTIIYGKLAERKQIGTEKYIPIILKYLVEQNFIDKIISDNLNKNLSKWFNKEELIYELRRKFPIAVLKEESDPYSYMIKRQYWQYMITDIGKISSNNLNTYKNILE